MKHKQPYQNTHQYFQSLLKTLSEHNQYHGYSQTSYPQTQQISNKCIQDAIDQIQFGIIQVKNQPDIIDQIITIPLHKRIGDDIDSIDRKIIEGEEILKQAKRQLLIHKKQQQQAMKLQNDIKTRENQQKIKIWSQQQKIYNKKRQQLFDKRQKQIQEEEQRQKQQKQTLKQLQFQERKQTVQERLKTFQQSRQKRHQLFLQSQQQTKRIKLPKFKEIEKQFQKVVAQQKFQKEIIKKNIKIAYQLNHDVLKEHEKNYMQKVFQRMKARGYTSQRKLNDEEKLLYESRFRNLLKRNDEDIEKQKQKFKRRISYQQRLEQININVDEDKKIKIQIAIDKAKNPFKYNFLGQKQLNDYQIYMQFKDFQLDIDRNELGNNYLEQSKKIGQQSRLKKSHSVSAISLKNRQKDFKYRDYLQQMRQHMSTYSTQRSTNDKNSLQEIIKKQSNKSKAILKVSHSLKKYDDEIRQRKNQLKGFNMISTTMRKQREIDQMYMKSLKAKLACLEIQGGK